jgi:hypothetical protein
LFDYSVSCGKSPAISAKNFAGFDKETLKGIFRNASGGVITGDR